VCNVVEGGDSRGDRKGRKLIEKPFVYLGMMQLSGQLARVVSFFLLTQKTDYARLLYVTARAGLFLRPGLVIQMDD